MWPRSDCDRQRNRWHGEPRHRRREPRASFACRADIAPNARISEFGAHLLGMAGKSALKPRSRKRAAIHAQRMAACSGLRPAVRGDWRAIGRRQSHEARRDAGSRRSGRRSDRQLAESRLLTAHSLGLDESNRARSRSSDHAAPCRGRSCHPVKKPPASKALWPECDRERYSQHWHPTRALSEPPGARADRPRRPRPNGSILLSGATRTRAALLTFG